MCITESRAYLCVVGPVRLGGEIKTGKQKLKKVPGETNDSFERGESNPELRAGSRWKEKFEEHQKYSNAGSRTGADDEPRFAGCKLVSGKQSSLCTVDHVRVFILFLSWIDQVNFDAVNLISHSIAPKVTVERRDIGGILAKKVQPNIPPLYRISGEYWRNIGANIGGILASIAKGRPTCRREEDVSARPEGQETTQTQGLHRNLNGAVQNLSDIFAAYLSVGGSGIRVAGHESSRTRWGLVQGSGEREILTAQVFERGESNPNLRP
ncbi:hypothetical protein B0H16DRAFT_1477069 [Mycena metata]|uniref:Uncharacterized protein n=1 Tax=Mycena metata TaxID=1033252 RepID=A0AAD7HAH8_9AGAR|nr:hypothetical protein B0H16DRAFT_1477069 [Mycena metata]